MSLPFINNEGIQVTVYRGSGTNFAPVWGPEDVEVNVQPVNFIVRPEANYTAAATYEQGNDYMTHRIFLDMAEATDFRPLLDDYLFVEGSLFGQFDGSYVVKQYPRPAQGFDGEIAYIELDVRFIGPKKPGDDNANDNSSNLRLGARNRGTKG